MINNQFSRRNLSTETRLALAYKFKEFEAEKARKRQGARNDLVDNISALVRISSKGDNDEQKGGRALGVIAKMAGVSERTADQYDKIQRKGTEEQKQEVAEGKYSVRRI